MPVDPGAPWLTLELNRMRVFAEKQNGAGSSAARPVKLLSSNVYRDFLARMFLLAGSKTPPPRNLACGFNGTNARMIVPRLGFASISNFPPTKLRRSFMLVRPSPLPAHTLHGQTLAPR